MPTRSENVPTPAGVRCRSCERYFGHGSCQAFPDEIPEAIWEGEDDHSKPFDGDNGVQFQDGGWEAPSL